LTAWLLPRALASLAGATVRIPVTGPPGTRAALSWPGEADGFAAAVAPDSPWRNEIAPGVFATVAFHRPLAHAGKIACPLWVGVGERDITVDRKSVEPFYGDAPARIAADQVEFLRRQKLATSPA
jgi:hypothetical protein